jgi:hypothetical protein
MVEYLVSTTGDARTPAVIDALGAVPRHLVIEEGDDADPAKTYAAEDVVVTKKDADGNSLSSVSAARIQAIQLGSRPTSTPGTVSWRSAPVASTLPTSQRSWVPKASSSVSTSTPTSLLVLNGF